MRNSRRFKLTIQLNNSNTSQVSLEDFKFTDNPQLRTTHGWLQGIKVAEGVNFVIRRQDGFSISLLNTVTVTARHQG